MSANTKAFVCCGKENLFDVVNSVVDHLNELCISLGKQYAKSIGLKNKLNLYKKYSESWGWYCTGSFLSNLSVISIDFKIGEKRSLHIFPDCFSDYNDVYDGDKIIFSIGCWGKNEEIIKVVCEAIKKFGDVYYCLNDCTDDFVKYNVK